MGVAIACDYLGVAGWTYRGLEIRTAQFEMLPGVRAVMGTAVLDAGQSSCTVWLLPFLMCWWSLITLTTLSFLCAAIFIHMHVFIRLPGKLRLLSKEGRCFLKSLVPQLASPCSCPGGPELQEE